MSGSSFGHSAKRCAGREFQRDAVTQEEMVSLLQESPLPWTNGMLVAWFGTRSNKLARALRNRRIKRVGHDLYTCPCKVEGEKVIVTDKMLERFGFNL